MKHSKLSFLLLSELLEIPNKLLENIFKNLLNPKCYWSFYSASIKQNFFLTNNADYIYKSKQFGEFIEKPKWHIINMT